MPSPYATPRIVETRRILPAHAADLEGSRIDLATAAFAGIRSVGREEARRVLGFDPRSAALAFPYPGRDGEKTFVRLKPDSPLVIGGKAAKYLTPKGAENRVYFPPLPYNDGHLLDPSVPLLVTEGEKKALKGAKELADAYVVIALPGVWCFFAKASRRRLHPDFSRVALKRRHVLLVFDSDAAINISVSRAEDRLAELLTRAGANVSILRLVPTPDGRKVGLDDYLVTHSAETFCELAAGAETWSPTRRLIEIAKAQAPAFAGPLQLDIVAKHRLLAEYLAYVRPITDAVDEYHVFVFLAVLGTILGRSVYFRVGGNRLYANFWIVILGLSSLDRKTTALNYGRDLLRRIDPDLLLPDEGSPEGLLAHLVEHPQVLFAHSELAAFLARLERSYMAGMKETLTDLYDCPPFYRRKLKGEDFTIESPCISILAATTLEWFTSKLVEGDLRSGFLARYLYVPAPPKSRSLPLPPPDDEGRKERILESLREIQMLTGELTLASDAREAYVAWFQKHEGELGGSENRETLAGFYTRLESYLLKMAMTLQLSDDGVCVIGLNAVQQAIHLVEWLKTNLRRLLIDEFAFSGEMKDRNRVLKFIRLNLGTRRGPILRNLHLSARQLDAAIATLCMAELVREVAGQLWSVGDDAFADVRTQTANVKLLKG